MCQSVARTRTHNISATVHLLLVRRAACANQFVRTIVMSAAYCWSIAHFGWIYACIVFLQSLRRSRTVCGVLDQHLASVCDAVYRGYVRIAEASCMCGTKKSPVTLATCALNTHTHLQKRLHIYTYICRNISIYDRVSRML